MGKAFHDAQGVVLQRLDLDGLAVPRRDHPIADFDVHPGQLHARFAGGEQPVAVHANVVARAVHLPRDDVHEYIIEVIVDEFVIGGILQELAYGLEEP